MVVFLISGVVFAGESISKSGPEQFIGKWKGQGTYILNGVITNCPVVEMEFKATADSFEFTTGRRVCEQHQETFYKVNMGFSQGKLTFGKEIVGDVNGSVLTSGYRMPEGDGRFRIWRMSMRKEGKHLMYEESRTMEGETTPMISFAGMLVLEEE